MNEASVTREFKHYLEEHKPKETECYEFKIVNLEKTKSFAFNRVADHQAEGLIQAVEGLWLKIPDTSAINGFSSQKPFDSIWIKAREGYVVPIFYSPRKFKKAFKIPVVDYLIMRDGWPRKSIRLEELETFEFETITL